MHLPEGQADLAGGGGLAVLSRAVPALLAPQRGTEITGGRLKLSSLAVRGGSEPTLQLNAELRGLAAQTPERMVRCEPITAAVDAASSPKAGVEVRRAEITTGFATASAHGSPGNVNGTLKADLGRLKEQLAGIVALPAEDMAGVITASVAAQRGSGDDIAVKVEADGSNLRYAHGAQTFAASRARVLQSGTVRVQDGAVARIDSSETALTLDDGVQVQAKGWLAPQDGTFSADVSVRQADLAYATRMLAAAGTENTKAMTGSARGDFKVSRQDAGGPVQSAGALTAEQLTVDGLPVVSTGKCRWQNVAFAPAAGSLRAGQVEVTSEPLRLTATNLDARLGDQPEASGEVKLSSDLHLLTTLLAGLGVLDTNPGITGTLTADGQMRTGGGAIDVSGQADVVNFTVPDAPSEAPRSAKFAYAARVDTERQSVGLQTFKLDSTLANLNLKGSIGYGARARTVALTGDYRLVWADVLPVIYALAPELRDQIALTGTSADKVQISGSLPEGETESVLSGLVARTGVGWETAQVLGVDLGRTDLAPTLRKGVVTLPAGPIPAASGTVRVGGSIDLNPTPPLLRMPGQTAVLEGVKVTPELARQLLTRFNPIFGHATELRGTVDLVVRDLELPLGKGITSGGSGGGTLTLDQFQIAPGGILAELLSLGKLARGMYVVDVSGLVFEVHDGRIHYRDLTLSFVQDKFDLKFYGSVGFDDTVDLVVSIPVGETVLERVGVRTGTAEYARLLAGLRVDVPVVGTRQNPRLDFSQVNVKSLLDQALHKQGEDLLTGGGLIDLIGGLSGKKGREEKSGGAETGDQRAPQATPAPEAEKPKPRSKKSGVRVGRRGDRKKSPGRR
ncbi:MAG: hypothetical protein H6816_13415 [Phycisphaerales bacterium]|nr:hypothetical protein [Phycisphaerales bacterium]